MNDLKRYNIFILLSSFSKGLIEVFIPIILYNLGFNVILYLLFKSLFNILSIKVTYYLINKISYTKILLISNILFSIFYLLVNFIKTNIYYLIILSFINSMYLITYTFVKHLYGINIIEEKKYTDNTSLYRIYSLIGEIPSIIVGSLLISNTNYLVLLVISLVISITSVLFLYKINITITSKNNNIKNTYPLKNYIFNIVNSYKTIIITLFPLYTYIYIKSKITYIGLLNIISSAGSIIYIYILSKRMDKNKKDYLKVSSILLSVIFTLKLILKLPDIFYIILFFEGVFKSSLDTIITRNIYCYSRNYNIKKYLSFIETLNSLSNSIILLILYIFKVSLINIIIIGIILIILNGFIGYDDGKYGYSN